ncbi:MAG: hypothetical protein HY904_08155, partial [Deltaproteobacteria bacterium]|nr:hypothetical protein [Deltaproteobacteria bacterium]
MRLRVALSMGGLLGVAGALNFVVVEHAAPGAGSQTLLVDLFAAVAATLLTLWLTARYESGIRRIAQGLQEVARDRKDLRFDVAREPLVANLAHAANDAIASLAEPTDPAVGSLRVRKRASQEMRVVTDGADAGVARVRSSPAPEPAPATHTTPLPAPAPPMEPPPAPPAAPPA